MNQFRVLFRSLAWTIYKQDSLQEQERHGYALNIITEQETWATNGAD